MVARRCHIYWRRVECHRGRRRGGTTWISVIKGIVPGSITGLHHALLDASSLSTSPAPAASLLAAPVGDANPAPYTRAPRTHAHTRAHTHTHTRADPCSLMSAHPLVHCTRLHTPHVGQRCADSGGARARAAQMGVRKHCVRCAGGPLGWGCSPGEAALCCMGVWSKLG